ncbi:DUF3089 domain-containing protein [Deinococcus detaillensis]|uniref:DUF3089 domain-containing protein n=1 Tax=Deinococcus detaillensis TaxID=2592048 RepID=A0A553UHY4_9DEIO|nr:DUF3089 domain-containing protein [Deinococcus detaillensis]TSA79800.1 DUF3089 domain-containing protein [Deinococcus detaillensis]
MIQDFYRKAIRPLLGGLALGLLAGCAPRLAAAPDYRSPQAWLCRPDQSSLCQTDLDATRIAPDGTRTRETFQADPQAPVDCFYVYPTASWDFAPNADLRPGGEADVTRQQAARFSSVCRVYAPLYRQNTIPALLGLEKNGGELAYQDVRAAWQTYLRDSNNGRPFVLIGHSQGSYHLIRLLAQDIEPDAALRSRLVSALLLGAPVSVPRGQDVGGSFQNVPLCRAADQTGCAVSYSAFAAGVPLPEPGDSPAFGRVPAAAPGQPEQHAACVNPAALTGGQATLHPYFTTKRTFPLLTAVQHRPAPWTSGAAIDTPFVTLPDFVTGECTERGGVSFLEVRVIPHPGSPRTTELGGTVNVAGRDLRAWGLHLIDIDLTQGDLIGLVRTQTAAWLAQPRP